MLFKKSVRTSKRTPHFTITKINWLMLFTVITIRTPFIQNTALQIVKIAGSYIYRLTLKTYILF